MAFKKKLSFIDLFAGCGGLSLGLETAGFFPVFVNELNHDALNTYIENRKDEYPHLLNDNFHSTNIKDLILNNKNIDKVKKSLEESFGINVQDSKNGLDLLVGGPPCQGYSGIGHRRSYSVDKKQFITNHLYQDMAFFINEFNPKIFLFENVRGLLSARWTKSGDKGEIWNDVLETFQNLSNYKIRWELIYSKNYGVPQNRPRILLVGIRNDLNFNLDENLNADGLLPQPSENNNSPDLVDLLSDLIDRKHKNGGENKVYVSDPLTNIQKCLRTKKDGNISKIGDALTEQEYSNHSNRIVEKFKFMIKNNGNIKDSDKTKKFSQKVLKKRWEKNGPNITATSLQDDYVHWEQPRTLTVREWARLQTFPDWYQFKGKRTTGGISRAGNPREFNFEREVPKYTQIGNAVPVYLAKQLGEHFAKILK